MNTQISFDLNNKGDHTEVHLAPKDQGLLVILGCSDTTSNGKRVTIALRGISVEGRVYQRIKLAKLEMVALSSIRRTEYQRIYLQFIAPHQTNHHSTITNPYPETSQPIHIRQTTL